MKFKKVKMNIFFVLGWAIFTVGTLQADNRGQTIYDNNCRFCHGYSGTGSGVLRKLFTTGISKLKAKTYSLTSLKAALSNKLSTRGKMPHFTSDLAEDVQLEQVLSYISSNKPAGKLLYSGSCAACHGVNIDGKGPMTGFRKNPAKLKGTSPAILKKRTQDSRSKYIQLNRKIPHIRTVPCDADLKALLKLIDSF